MSQNLRPLLLSLLFAVASLHLGAQTSHVLREDIAAKPFKKLSVGWAFDVYLQIGPEYKVTLEISERWRDNVEIRFDDEQMTVNVKRNKLENSWGKRDVRKLYITLPTLNELYVHGASDVVMREQDTLKTEFLDLIARGASDIRLSLNVGQLRANSQGASDIYLSGHARQVTFTSQGASDLRARYLRCDKANVTAQGASSVSIRCEGELDVYAKGASDVVNYGNGRIINAHGTGASNIRSRD